MHFAAIFSSLLLHTTFVIHTGTAQALEQQGKSPIPSFAFIFYPADQQCRAFNVSASTALFLQPEATTAAHRSESELGASPGAGHCNGHCAALPCPQEHTGVPRQGDTVTSFPGTVAALTRAGGVSALPEGRAASAGSILAE